jgi:hypothetical protein
MGIKSRESRKKNRRWSFCITTQDKGFHIPVVCFGTKVKATQVAERIKQDYGQIETLAGRDFNVELIAHETVSHETQQQFDGLEFEGRILTKVCELVFDDYLSAKGKHEGTSAEEESEDDKRKAIGMYVVRAKELLMKEYYPEGATAIEDSLEREREQLSEVADGPTESQ